MFGKTNTIVRSAGHEDLNAINQLVHFDALIHRHLDYQAPLGWFGNEPFLLLQQEGKIKSVLICPPDPPEVAWIRLFATTRAFRLQIAWDLLWSEAKERLLHIPGVAWVTAIPLQSWFKKVLEKDQFELNHHIVMMRWEKQPVVHHPPRPGLSIRLMSAGDLASVFQIDQQAFVPVWQNSLNTLKIAFNQAGIATVALFEGKIAGYQISTPTHIGGHLARLAVIPDLQGKGLGSALLCDMLERYTRRGALAITVNTQKDNQASLSLYKKAGFKLSGEEYPIYIYAMS